MEADKPKPMNGNDIIIRISNLKKKFGNFTAVDRTSFDIYKREVFGFLGPNDAGKTTSINMICGLSPPTEGEVIFGNQIKNNNDIKTRYYKDSVFTCIYKYYMISCGRIFVRCKKHKNQRKNRFF